MQIIKDSQIIDDGWRLIASAADYDATSTVADYLILPLELYLQLHEQGKTSARTGVWLDSDQPPDALADICMQPGSSLQLIALNFPVFSDGRPYSYAHKIRQQFHFRGELRAVGDVLKDQLFYMRRCGFDAFALRDQDKISDALSALTTFKYSYQGAVDDHEPLFVKRQA